MKADAIRMLVDNFRSKFLAVKEICLLSEGLPLYSTIRVNVEGGYYAFRMKAFIDSGTHILKNLPGQGAAGRETQRISIAMKEYSIFIQAIKTQSFLIVLYDNTTDWAKNHMGNEVGLLAKKLRSHVHN